MSMETKSNLKSSMMAGNQSAIYQVESFLGVGKIKRGAASHVNCTARGHDFIL